MKKERNKENLEALKKLIQNNIIEKEHEKEIERIIAEVTAKKDVEIKEKNAEIEELKNSSQSCADSTVVYVPKVRTHVLTFFLSLNTNNTLICGEIVV